MSYEGIWKRSDGLVWSDLELISIHYRVEFVGVGIGDDEWLAVRDEGSFPPVRYHV